MYGRVNKNQQPGPSWSNVATATENRPDSKAVVNQPENFNDAPDYIPS